MYRRTAAAESLGPRCAPRAACASDKRELGGLERAVGLHRAREGLARHGLLRHRREQLAKALEVGFAQRQARGLRVAAEAQDEARRALGDEVEASRR